MNSSNTVSSSANLYPFLTKGQIKTRLAEDVDFRRQAMVILFQLQTAHEQSTSTTLSKNRQGFMSSHAVWGTKIARKIAVGEDLTEEEVSKMDAIAPRYSRQLAVFFRAQMVAENPALKAAAVLFSAAEADEA
jgi:hypothetical protein